MPLFHTQRDFVRAACGEPAEERPFRDALRRLWRENPTARVSAVVIALFVLAALLAPVLTGYSYEQQDLAARLAAPSAAHWLGTDEAGRDLLTRLLYGSRVSLLVGVVPTVISMDLRVHNIAGAAGYGERRGEHQPVGQLHALRREKSAAVDLVRGAARGLHVPSGGRQQ